MGFDLEQPSDLQDRVSTRLDDTWSIHVLIATTLARTENGWRSSVPTIPSSPSPASSKSWASRISPIPRDSASKSRALPIGTKSTQAVRAWTESLDRKTVVLRCAEGTFLAGRYTASKTSSKRSNSGPRIPSLGYRIRASAISRYIDAGSPIIVRVRPGFFYPILSDGIFVCCCEVFRGWSFR